MGAPKGALNDNSGPKSGRKENGGHMKKRDYRRTKEECLCGARLYEYMGEKRCFRCGFIEEGVEYYELHIKELKNMCECFSLAHIQR